MAGFGTLQRLSDTHCTNVFFFFSCKSKLAEDQRMLTKIPGTLCLLLNEGNKNCEFMGIPLKWNTADSSTT